MWWDFENCNLPAGVNVFKVAHTITAAVRTNGIKGPVTITAFGDILQLSRVNQEALSSTGINLTHIPHGGKNSADRSLLVDLMYWVSQNPPPAHLFLISGDRDFASILHRLRMNNYNILLASPESAPGVLCSAASIMWHWHALVRGEKLNGKHFNQPPDGPYGSWYGHYKLPLEDPFSVTEQPACAQTEQPACPRAEDLPEAGSDIKLRSVPKTVVRLVRHILNDHPKGISITDLRSELAKSNVSIDKDLYGYKKFSRFLLSMPHILKLRSEGDGQYVVSGVTPKIAEPFDCNSVVFSGPISNNGDQDLIVTSKLNGEDKSIAGAVDRKLSLPPSSESNVEEPPKKMHKPYPLDESVTGAVDGNSPLPPSPELNVRELQQQSQVDKKVVEPVNEGHLPPVVEQDSASEVGFFKKVWRKCLGSSNGGSKNKSKNIPEKCTTSVVDSSEEKSQTTVECSTSVSSSENTKVEDKSAKSRSQDANPVCPVSYSSASNESGVDSKTATGSEAYGDKSRTTPGFFNRIVNWCKFWKSDPNYDILNDQSSKKVNQINIHSEKNELFSKDSFWIDVESFLDTHNGSVVVSQSRTREQMAQNLQKEGPLALRSLSEHDLLLLVDLLISEMKWVEECPSQTSPFKLTLPVGKSLVGDSRGSNGLRSIFLGTTSPEHDGKKKCQNFPHTGVSPPIINKRLSIRSRSDILADCQKLVNEILKEHPEGYNMGSFRKLFLERYGYALDLQRLGYQKLASLLQIMPGVKIESAYIIPSGKAPNSPCLESAVPDSQKNNATHLAANSGSESTDATKKCDDFDSPWEELGPVSNTSSRNGLEFASRRKDIEQTERPKYPDYEPSVSDDEFSDSEKETSTLTGPEGQGKRINEEDSSLLQILDSWYSSKEGDDKNNKSENVEGMIDCSTNGSKPSGSSAAKTNNESLLGNNVRKQRPQKSYSFVADQVGSNKDKLIDGILGSLKKSDDSRIQG